MCLLLIMSVYLLLLMLTVLSNKSVMSPLAVNTFAGFGMDLNVSAGKSECVVDFAGKGKKKITTSMHSNGDAIDIVVVMLKLLTLNPPNSISMLAPDLGRTLMQKCLPGGGSCPKEQELFKRRSRRMPASSLKKGWPF